MGIMGSAVWRKFEREAGFDSIGQSSDELDLTNQAKVSVFISADQPNSVVKAATKVG